MKKLRIPTRMGFIFLALFLLNIIAIFIGLTKDNEWYAVAGIVLSVVQCKLHRQFACKYSNLAWWRLN